VTVLGDTSATEMDATNAKGYYLFDLTHGRDERRHAPLFSAKSSTSNIVVVGVPATVFTDPPNFNKTSIDSNGRLDIVNVSGVAQTGGDLFTAITNIAVTGAPLNTTATSATYTTGTDTGGVNNTFALDGVYDSVADATGAIDFYYLFNLSATTGAVATSFQWIGYVAGVVNTVKAYYYDWGATAYVQIGTVVGIAGTVNGVEEWALPAAATGTGGDAGKVRLRFQATGLTAASVKTDRVLCGYAVVPLAAAAAPPNFSALAVTAAGGVTLADGVLHGGTPGSSTATLAFSRMVGQSQTPDTAAFSMTGNGMGDGMYATSTDSGSGMNLVGGPSGGKGLVSSGTGSGSGGLFQGGNAGASGLVCQGNGMFGAGLELDAFGASGAAMYLYTASGPAIQIVPTDGDGIQITPALNVALSANAIQLVAAGTGHDIHLAGSADILGNLTGTINGLTAAGLATLFTVNSTKVYADAVTGSPVKEIATHVTATTVSDKTGYSLAATGLDSIPITAPAGVASTFREMIVATWRRFFKRTTKSSTQIKTYADNNTTVVTTQSYTTGATDDVGAAS
jgi:hypothetical protein